MPVTGAGQVEDGDPAVTQYRHADLDVRTETGREFRHGRILPRRPRSLSGDAARGIALNQIEETPTTESNTLSSSSTAYGCTPPTGNRGSSTSAPLVTPRRARLARRTRYGSLRPHRHRRRPGHRRRHRPLPHHHRADDPWRDDLSPEWTRFPIACLHHAKTTGLWTLYWRDRHLKFHRYQALAPSPHVQGLLDYLDEQADPISWG
ncbi:DUF3024 domain-containing protein [Nocardia sp. NPDC050718]|uniref:DUF3024 domain-containing protein n=1 Tax=Nocardia sp. NPDC050718 TaxID=3155788 RepID=UPI0033EECEDF